MYPTNDMVVTILTDTNQNSQKNNPQQRQGTMKQGRNQGRVKKDEAGIGGRGAQQGNGTAWRHNQGHPVPETHSAAAGGLKEERGGGKQENSQPHAKATGAFAAGTHTRAEKNGRGRGREKKAGGKAGQTAARDKRYKKERTKYIAPRPREDRARNGGKTETRGTQKMEQNQMGGGVRKRKPEERQGIARHRTHCTGN